MAIRFLLSVLLGLLAWPAIAAPVVISDRNCRDLIEHKPAADVAYQPGVDAKGRPVVGADLNGGYDMDLPQVYRFDLTVQPFDLKGEKRDRDPNFEETGLVLGEILIDDDGRAFFNGKAIQPQAQRELTLYCQVIDNRD